LKPERWGSPLVQEKYQEEKACDKTTMMMMIIIIIIIKESLFWPIEGTEGSRKLRLPDFMTVDT
jgi:hypothetical protein